MKSRIYLVLVALVSMTLLVSYEDNPPNGRTGAPGDGLCSDCHSLNGGLQDGSITVTGLPASIEPSTAYFLTVTNSNPNGIADIAGFQVTILNGNNQKAGAMTMPSVNSTVTPSGGRDYWEHDPAQLYAPNNTYQWTVTWTSPAGPAGTTITAYAAGNVANNNGDNDGDLIVVGTSSGMLMGSGDPLQVDIISQTDVLCNGSNSGSATAGATGGSMPYNYVWSSGGTNATVSNLFEGTYFVTVTDNDGSTATTSVVISEPAALVLQNPSITNVSCFGGTNGSIQASATGGTPTYAYNWSNGSSGSTISNLSAGSYTVTVTDDNNCTKLATYQVTQPALIVINLINLNDESCFGEDDGSISISITGGATPVFAEWSNGFIGTTITDLAPDTYSVTVTDNNDCTKTESYTVNAGGLVNVTLEDLNHVTCNGGNDGSISVSANGGQSPYTYAWSNGGTGENLINLSAGNYLVTATDASGCEVVKLYTVNQPAPITVQINVADENLCASDSLVDLTAVATGPQSPFTGLWSNGVTGLTNENVPAGSYTITVTDAIGCTASTSVTVVSPTSLVISVVTTDESAVGANDGTAVALVSGGTPGYTYLWSNGSTADSIGGLAPGLYTVTITDTNLCTVTASGQVDPFGCSLDIDLGPDLTICEGELITISAPPGLVSYLWSIGTNGQSIEVGGGEYCVTVVDAENCQDVDCIIVTELTFPLITCPVTNESLPGENDGAIACDSTSGSIQYLWSDGSTTPSISGLAPGTYCVTMSDANGCTAEQCFTVQPGNCQLVLTSIISDVLCYGDSTGSISLNLENSTPPILYSWSNGAGTVTNDSLPAGEYSVSITDADGCVITNNFVVNQPEFLVINVDSVSPVMDFPSGSIDVTATGGVMPYSYQWTAPDGSMIFQEDLAQLFLPGVYTLLVTDANQCTSTVSAEVEIDLAVNPGHAFKQLKVYPVPATDLLHVELEHQITEAHIIGIDGRLNKRIVNPATNNLQVGELEPGLYIIRMTDGESWYIARMVK
jgi:hypothetical protein